MNKENKGKLYIVGTPIGNIRDITLRALDTLKEVDIILAEDTRQTLKLLNIYEITKKCISFNWHTEKEKMEYVKKLLDEGNNIALVSDAGMPRISDPGEDLVLELIEGGYNIEVVPGVTAVTTALALSNLDSGAFTFIGFLPMKPANRKEVLEKMKYMEETIVLYEAPHKILKTLKDLKETFGNRRIVIARELTKLHEEFRYSNLEEQISKIEEEGIKGEIVLLIEGEKEGNKKRKEKEIKEQGLDLLSNKELVLKYIKEGQDKKDAIKRVAKERKLNKNEVYMECVEIDR